MGKLAMYVDFLTDSITQLVWATNRYNPGELEHDVAIQLLPHLNEIPQLSIQEVADLCFCSVTAISRFVKKLKFENFTTFKYRIASDLTNSPKLNLRIPAENMAEPENLSETYFKLLKSGIDELSASLSPEMIDRATSLMLEAQTVLFYSLGDLGFTELQVDLALSGKASWHVSGFDDLLNVVPTLGGNTLVVAAMFPTMRGKTNMEKLRELDTKIIVVSRGNANTYAKYADAFFTTRSTGTKMDQHLVRMLFDVLAMHFRMKSLD